ncbi:hypothetical protein [Pseudomonas sp. KCJK8521]|uniref:hypothetical protein n=1 Tax=Pseudomonas sp. KCJK8521 TaxID=3344557 RepID=UPI003906B8C8
MTTGVSEFCTVVDLVEDGDHHWAVVMEKCDLSDATDKLLALAAQAIRDAYGEQEIREIAEEASFIQLPEPADTVLSQFNLGDLLASFREGLPNPDAEGNKPGPLSNYRSETAEILAREALARVFKMLTPPSLHATKGNRNQPILGFDGWTLMGLECGGLALVLIQVKATDDQKRPPGEAAKLITECSKAPVDLEKLKGFISACAIRCKGTHFGPVLVSMLAGLHQDKCVKDIIVAPVLIRGVVEADHDDLSTLKSASGSFVGARTRGISLSVGANLNEFGRAAMNMARQS